MTISFTVNGASQRVADDMAAEPLLDYLHEALDLTGTKLCCGIGVCRACTVAVTKGATTTAMISCSTPLSVLDGTDIRTVEHVAQGEQLSAIQTAFLENFSFQCGYCTPGFVMGATVLLEQIAASPIEEAQLDRAIADAIGEHICRCTGYVRYFEAVKATALKVIADKTGARQ